MSTPVTEKEQHSFPAFQPNKPPLSHDRRSSDEDGTLNSETEEYTQLKHQTSYADGPDHINRFQDVDAMSNAEQREESQRLVDDLVMLGVEQEVEGDDLHNDEDNTHIGRGKSLNRSRSRHNGSEPPDDFDIGTTPIHEKAKIYKPPANPTTKLAKFFKKIHQSSFLVRYFCYIAPLALLLLIPIFFGLFLFKDADVGGVKLFWFGVWLEIIWLTLWAGRILAKCIPYPMGVMSSLFTNNDKKWRDLGKALEVPASLFFWWLAIEISFLPTMKNHHVDGDKSTRDWEKTANKVLVSLFIGIILNFVEKILIQLIAISFHLRTYADRIEVNKFQISSLVKLYTYSKTKINVDDSEFETRSHDGETSGARTPMIYVEKAKKNAAQVFNKVGDVAGKVAGDFTGKQVTGSTHPHQIILQLLNSTAGSQVLARRTYRTFVRDGLDTVSSDDLRLAFDNDDEAGAAFSMFDRDLNGDISMDELESVCVEIGRERKAITASLKDLDSVVSKLDNVLLFVVMIITTLVFISLISTSAATALTSLGSTVLALSWLLSATAQEFLQSLIFVFVKHPFDVGDRVTIYGNTGSLGTGDDYFVKEISLLYTEFKKMEGHVVQAPNSYLNTLFILNQRRSGGLAEAVPVTVKFGTSLEQIEKLRSRLLEFVTLENREYQKNILTELRTITDAYSITMNVVFFYKSNWQNELLRLQRRNKFICAMMVTMQELGIEGPRMRLAGAAPEFPMYLNGAYPQTQGQQGPEGPSQGPRAGSLARDNSNATNFHSAPVSHPSILRKPGSSVAGRHRGESMAAMGKRVDFSLGIQGQSSGAEFGDVFDAPKPRLPIGHQAEPFRERSSRESNLHDTSNRDESESLRNTASRDSNATNNPYNRFFRRNQKQVDDGADLADLESGTREVIVNQMPNIPEVSGNKRSVSPVAIWNERDGTTENIEMGTGVGRGRGRQAQTDATQYPTRNDPWSGTVSPKAGISDSMRDIGGLPMASFPRPDQDQNMQ
ncbi:Mechanosensitive ion channel-domain-containing protein [Calycina marina]|uniref:Mechanosensitive ion channel protein n=1 Tax=Calycina marina TaxID=1763456 RepID=A0A9P7YXZ3_9HELO|nr:Mechanosensitive ion channel-domain-containing protein [Calycina marina]